MSVSLLSSSCHHAIVTNIPIMIDKGVKCVVCVRMVLGVHVVCVRIVLGVHVVCVRKVLGVHVMCVRMAFLLFIPHVSHFLRI